MAVDSGDRRCYELVGVSRVVSGVQVESQYGEDQKKKKKIM